MQFVKTRALSSLLCLGHTVGCITDTVPPDIYASNGTTASPATADDQAPEGPITPALSDAGAPPAQDQPLGSDPPIAGCDLTGSWLITERLVATGLGVKQASLVWRYYELAQSGEQLRVEKGLVCGGQIQPIDLVAAAVDFPAARPKQLSENPQAGRQGRASASAAGCSVSFARSATVLGATTPYYTDESHGLPTLDQQASGSSPGWEDWDNDGIPGVGLKVSGLANGTRHCSTRTSATWQGDVASGADHFKLGVQWSSVESVYEVTDEVLRSTGVPDGNASLHFAEFARLSPGQVSGDDQAICAKIRELAPALTPDANQ
jgi:hypothetical protein